MKNLFSNLPSDPSEELIESLVDGKSVRIERIVSRDHASPDGFWYDQPQSEWVTVLRGRARLLFFKNEGDEEAVELGPGDFINIPAHSRHRVEWTTPDEPTVWLAVFYV